MIIVALVVQATVALLLVLMLMVLQTLPVLASPARLVEDALLGNSTPYSPTILKSNATIIESLSQPMKPYPADGLSDGANILRAWDSLGHERLACSSAGLSVAIECCTDLEFTLELASLLLFSRVISRYWLCHSNVSLSNSHSVQESSVSFDMISLLWIFIWLWIFSDLLLILFILF